MTRISRSAESRIATSRPLIGGDERGHLDIDVSGLPADMAPRWIREESMGQYDEKSVVSAMERGFRPVTTDQLPSYQTFRLPGSRAASAADGNNLIRRGGLVLMARERHLDQAEKDAQAARTTEATRSVARDTAALKDGTNIRDIPDANISSSFEGARGKFSE